MTHEELWKKKNICPIYHNLIIQREKAMAPHSSTLAWKLPWMEEPGRLQSMGLRRVGHDWATSLSLFTFTFHFHSLEKETATHSSVLAWRIPGTEGPGGLPSMGSHRVRHNWNDLAAIIQRGWATSSKIIVPADKVLIIAHDDILVVIDFGRFIR